MSSSAEARRRLLERRLSGRAADSGIRRAPRDRPLPLSPAQRRMWLLDQLLPGTAEYVVPLVLRLPGRARIDDLGTALSALAERHDILRTRYTVLAGEVHQVVDDAAPLPLPVVELGGEPLDDAVQREISRPFNLARGPVWRAALLRGADDVLVVSVHHVACDGWSMEILARELVALYEGAELPDAPVQYADFALWQRDRLTGDRLRRRLDFWRAELAGLDTLELPTDRPRTAPRDPSGARVSFTLSPRTGRALRELSSSQGATLFMALLAAFAALLARHTGQTDIAVGTPVLGRPRSEIEDTVGPFINTVVLRCDLSGDPGFSELLARVRETALGAFANDDLPFERLVEELRPERDLTRNPLVQVMLLLEDGDLAGNASNGWEELPVASPAVKMDLMLGFRELPDGTLAGGLEYATALFDARSAERLAERLVRLLDRVVADPGAPIGRLPLMGEEERALVAGWATGPVTPPPRRCLHELVEETVRQAPDAVAVISATERLTYAELDARAARLAGELRAQGAGPDRPVAVCLRRSAELVVALLAVLKAGGAYLPLDPDDPPARLADLVAESGAACVVTDPTIGFRAQDVPTVQVEQARHGTYATDGPARVSPENLAYVIYTSGSTGRPKGVMVPHQGIVNRLLWMQHRYGLAPGDRVLQKTPYTFDVSVWEFFWPLLAGATVVVAPPGTHRDPVELAAFMNAQEVSHVHFVPSMLDAFLDAARAFEGGRCPQGWRQVFCSGEALRPATARRFFAMSEARLHNLYGPTEASVDVTSHEVTPSDERIPIGKPISGVSVHVLDAELNPVPAGVPGEIHLGGVGLARGYLGRPDLTAERFVPAPSGRGRLYRTGDRGHLLPDGSVEYLGRLDDQVKLHGLRIELGEIEAHLLACPSVAMSAVAVVREQLVAYVVPAEGRQVSGAELRAHLSGRLPAYMIPARYVSLDELPLTVSGKIDRARLPEPPRQRTVATSVPPRTPVEEVMAAAWCEVLGLDQVGVTDGFFDVGGDSMRAVRLVGELRSRGLDVTVADVFTRTIESLAEIAGGPTERIDDLRSEPLALLSEQDRSRLPDGAADAYPLSAVQAGMVFEMLSDAEILPYKNVTGYRITGELVLDDLRRAARAVTRRHPLLRTSVDLDTYSEPVQIVHHEAEPEIAFTSLAGTPDAHAAIDDILAAERSRPFDLAVAPLWRLHAFELSAGEWWLAIVECHVILDGWSHNALLAQLMEAYGDIRAGRDPDTTEPNVTYADFVAMERRTLESAGDRDFWSSRLTSHDRLVLPSRWREPGPDRVENRVFGSAHLEEGVRSLAAACGVSPKTVFLTAFAATLAPLAASDRFFFGMVSSSRPEAMGGYDVFGMFLNTVPFAVTRPSGTWREMIAEVFAEEVALWPHRRMPLPALQRAYGGRGVLIEAAFDYLDFYTVAGTGVVDLSATKDDSPNELPFEMTVMPGRILVTTRRARLGERHAVRLGERFIETLQSMIADPDGPATSAAGHSGHSDNGAEGIPHVPDVHLPRRSPRDAREKAVAAVLEEVLDLAEIGVEDDFYEAGGHSLAAMRVASRLRTLHGLHVTPRQVMELGTCEALARAAVELRVI
ncbi:amino acid adenylation domain-containing protein [Nonomuraea sp. NPDC050451]|uniref:amino acid adenylation domain-containing protein n=1 Tax=Nonomuraea sp. NPDC050451 TaxID=3364364 RepID=UPI0037B3E42A